MIGVGSIITSDDIVEAIEELNLPLIAIGRQLLVELDLINKVRVGKQDTIQTEIRPEDKDDLAFPNAMWEYVQTRPGWLPIVK